MLTAVPWGAVWKVMLCIDNCWWDYSVYNDGSYWQLVVEVQCEHWWFMLRVVRWSSVWIMMVYIDSCWLESSVYNDSLYFDSCWQGPRWMTRHRRRKMRCTSRRNTIRRPSPASCFRTRSTSRPSTHSGITVSPIKTFLFKLSTSHVTVKRDVEALWCWPFCLVRCFSAAHRGAVGSHRHLQSSPHWVAHQRRCTQHEVSHLHDCILPFYNRFYNRWNLTKSNKTGKCNTFVSLNN